VVEVEVVAGGAEMLPIIIELDEAVIAQLFLLELLQ
jgi:hypothetical protein